MKFPSYKNKKVLILGLGLLGRGLKDTIFFAKQGAKVTVTDLKTKNQLKPALEKLKKYKNIKYVLGKHRFEDIDQADLIIRNADVPLKSKYLQYALKNNKKVEMDESLFAKFCPCPIIGITGTRGKTTTTTLIAELLKNTGKKVYLAGNIMNAATLPLIKKIKPDDIVVLELSSWQLQGFAWKKISPHISVFTNLYPDHLNRYSGMAEYFNDKKNIFKYQTKNDFLILNAKQPKIKNLSKNAKAKVSFFQTNDIPKSWKLKIIGKHNLENVAAAIQVAKILKVKSTDIKKTIENFPGVEHRLEFIKTLKGVDYYNDTTSTTPVSSINAIKSFNKNIILIAGGASKTLDLGDFAKEISKNKKVKAVILLEGTATDELEEKIIKYKGQRKIFSRFDNFKEAILAAQTLAKKNEVILLSPGCASFGMFINEFDRGNQFKKFVKKLK